MLSLWTVSSMIGIQRPQLSFYHIITIIIKYLLTILSHREKTSDIGRILCRETLSILSLYLKYKLDVLYSLFLHTPRSSYFLWKFIFRMLTLKSSSHLIVNFLMIIIENLEFNYLLLKSNQAKGYQQLTQIEKKKLFSSIRSYIKRPSLPQHMNCCGSNVH